jgi:orotidine-5'-phosphate decarboxylase
MGALSVLPKDRIILPLDVDSLDQATRLVMDLDDHVGLFKIGLALYMKEGPRVIQSIQHIVGNRIFLDLKFHDIPETVRKASKVLVPLSRGIRFVTVHTSEGEIMVKAAVDALKGGTQVLGVTVLTSSGDQKTAARVLELSKIAKDAGCAGVVCSGHEAKPVKQELGKDFIVVTPGIRPRWSTIPGDDQKRVMTPQEAIMNGADYIVVGRPIHTAKNPVEAANKITTEIADALRLRK